MSAGSICSRIVATVAPTESILVAARRMAKHDVGTLVVLDGPDGGKVIGVVTDRDIAIRCTAPNRDPESTAISEIMSSPVHTVNESTGITEAVSRMARHGTRRLVVTSDTERLVGILSLDDLLSLATEQAAAITEILQAQQPKIPA